MIEIGLAVSEEKLFENVDDADNRRRTNVYTISFPGAFGSDECMSVDVSPVNYSDSDELKKESSKDNVNFLVSEYLLKKEGIFSIRQKSPSLSISPVQDRQQLLLAWSDLSRRRIYVHLLYLFLSPSISVQLVLNLHLKDQPDGLCLQTLS